MRHDIDRSLRNGMILTLITSLIASLLLWVWRLVGRWPLSLEKIVPHDAPHINFIMLLRLFLVTPRLLAMTTNDTKYVVYIRNACFVALVLLSALYIWQTRKK